MAAASWSPAYPPTSPACRVVPRGTGPSRDPPSPKAGHPFHVERAQPPARRRESPARYGIRQRIGKAPGDRRLAALDPSSSRIEAATGTSGPCMPRPHRRRPVGEPALAARAATAPQVVPRQPRGTPSDRTSPWEGSDWCTKLFLVAPSHHPPSRHDGRGLSGQRIGQPLAAQPFGDEHRRGSGPICCGARRPLVQRGRRAHRRQRPSDAHRPRRVPTLPGPLAKTGGRDRWLTRRLVR